ncbi:MAG: S9 family peptidase [Alphaproteobacteria bacterium]|nr:S9 family peptidase [Alphaproteobacteria bacterium]
MRPPKAAERPHTVTFHGHERTDPYAWLRDENWQQLMQKPEVLKRDIRKYLEAENAHTAAAMKDAEPAIQSLVEEMKGRIKRDDSTVPAPDGPCAYYQRYERDSQHPIFCRNRRITDEHGGPAFSWRQSEQVLLDVNRLAEGKPFFRVSAVEHSPDHRLLAYSSDDKGSETHDIIVRDIATGEIVDNFVKGTDGSIEWANDSRTLFYCVLDENHRPSLIYRHSIGQKQAKDVLVYEEKDPGFFVAMGKTESRRFLVINTHDHVTSEFHVIDADDPHRPPRLLASRTPGVEYHVTHHDGRFYIQTNADGAEDFKIATAPVDAPARDNWQDLVPHEPGRLLLGMRMTARFLARMERVDGLPRIVIRRLEDGVEHTIAFQEEAYDLGILPGYEYATTTLRFAYSSPTTPREVYDYDMEARSRVLKKRQEVPSGHDPALYACRRLMAPSTDGEMVPITVLHRRDTSIDGTAPCVLYGYGAYGASMPSAFAPNRFSLVDRGFVYATAHIRGGTERGYRWYREGRLQKKANTFRDYVAAAEHLIAQRYTSQGRIAAHGGSAGGLLVGAAVNMRPDLFGAAVAEVPFVDVLNTMTDGTLPLTPPEWPEWGNPITDADAYRTILGYSPYDNVAAKAYPNLLVTAGLADPRVTYWEPAKWVAKLRAKKTDSNLLLLKTNMAAGHAGAAGRFSKLEEIALIYAFLLKVFDRLGLVGGGCPGSANAGVRRRGRRNDAS